MATIYSMDGGEITVGLQGCDRCDEAIQAAERWADMLSADVELVDDDGRWIVHPSTEDGSRRPADPVEDDEDDEDDGDDGDDEDDEDDEACAG